jgi:uncharacterized protein (TIGR03435 family)
MSFHRITDSTGEPISWKITHFVIALSVVMSVSAQDSRPRFEVASIKPNVTGNGSPSYEAQPGGRFLIGNAPFKLMLALAYTLRDYQISGGPSWIATDRWDLQAKAPEGSIPAGLEYPSPATPNHPLFLMLQSLLEDRFQLRVHREARDEPVYELSVAKNGSKMKLSADQDEVDFPTGPTRAEPVPRGRIRMQGPKIDGRAIRIAQLVSILSDTTKRPVINKTGLSGLYDFTLEWSPEPGLAANQNGQPAAPPNDSRPSFLTALQEQLGLKLESARGPVEVLVVDSVSKPSEN